MSRFLQQQPLILASGSAIRCKLLKSLGLEFDVVPSNCDEASIKNAFQSSDVYALGQLLAQSKALEVSHRFPNAFIIAADQLCIIGEQILDKPMTHKTAIEHLQLLSGKQHQQIACLCIAKGEQILWQYQSTANVTLLPLNSTTIENYLQKEKPYHSCGAYQFETLGKWLFQEVQGNEDTILGLPLLPLIAALKDLKAVQI